ncbi:DUF1405 domain-containing protein [Gottfriedia acidiceleris]|uniref:DUF1405 domain-containing protein n=1 Tax=Gottfriedia acidiceleris TaxID=371036 RepID=UPI00101BBB9C|nr:DUF1405 domain-containing protein [Gottfriedia acidiceleris]
MKAIIQLLSQRWILWSVLLVNIFGTIYGFLWYGSQLLDTSPKYLIFVPDSPTASLFFMIVIFGFLIRRNYPLLEALAIVTLFKYGIWAVAMNLLELIVTGELSWQGYMLIVSHFAMAVQGLLYSPFYRFKGWHLAVAAIWTFHNDVIDYLFNMMPRYGVLDVYKENIGYFTLWLSVLSICIPYYLVLRKKHCRTELP